MKMAPKRKNNREILDEEGKSNFLLVKTARLYLYSFSRYSRSKFVKFAERWKINISLFLTYVTDYVRIN